MIAAFPNESRVVRSTTPSVPLTGISAREGKQANLLPDHREHRPKTAHRDCREFRAGLEVSG